MWKHKGKNKTGNAYELENQVFSLGPIWAGDPGADRDLSPGIHRHLHKVGMT